MRHRVGKKVKANSSHPEVKTGMRGHVASVHDNQRFYGVMFGGSLAYLPAHAVDPDNDGDVDPPGQPDNDAPMPAAPTSAAAIGQGPLSDRAKDMYDLRRARRGG